MKVSELIDFSPKFFSIFKNYSREKFSADLMAGMIVGVVAIPLAIAAAVGIKKAVDAKKAEPVQK